MKTHIIINNLRCALGQQKNGVDLGGDVIINKLQSLNQMTQSAINTIEFKSSAIYDGYTQTYNQIYSIIDQNFVLNLGGDHSVGACTIQPLLDKYKDNVLIIWIDAHADANTMETSPSQNTHGMPVAPLLGIMNHWYKLSRQPHLLNPSNLLYVGIRDLDPGEIELIDRLNIKYFKDFTPETIRWVNAHPASKIHISLDIDGIDPQHMPSTGTLSHHGLNMDDVIAIITESNPRLISMDLVEFNPLVGTKKDQEITLGNIVEILDCFRQ
jgi:arginase